MVEGQNPEDLDHRRHAAQARRLAQATVLRSRAGQIPREAFLVVLDALAKFGPPKVSPREATCCIEHAGVHYAAPVVVALAMVKMSFPDVGWDVSARDVVEAGLDVPTILGRVGLQVVACDCAARRRGR